jgi:hypothetical protein
VQESRHCAAPDEIEDGIRLASAALALNMGDSGTLVIDESPEARANCPNLEPEAFIVQGSFPEGLLVCLNCGQIGSTYADVNKACKTRCLDTFSVDGPSNHPAPRRSRSARTRARPPTSRSTRASLSRARTPASGRSILSWIRGASPSRSYGATSSARSTTVRTATTSGQSLSLGPRLAPAPSTWAPCRSSGSRAATLSRIQRQ